MKIITYNVNGIRSAITKGLLDWIKGTAADVLCFQEVKATADQIDESAFKELGLLLIGLRRRKKDIAALLSLQKLFPSMLNMVVVLVNTILKQCYTRRF